MNTRRRTHSAAAAFTLLELMISIAIVLVLMLGINFVFGTSSRTVSQGLALTAVNREIRGARKVFETDFGSVVSAAEMPALVIHGEAVLAFRDRQDQLADQDGAVQTFDLDGDQSNVDEIDLGPMTTPLQPGFYNFRRHRADRLSFFVRSPNDAYARQTGDNTTYVGSETSAEAWISYGLLRLPENTNTTIYWKPGAGTFTSNPNNYFASQWILGRRRMLLQSDANLTALQVYQTGTAPGQLGINFGARSEAKTATPPAGGAWNRQVQPPYTTATAWRTEESRIDQVNGSISDLTAAITALGNAWWDDVDFGVDSVNYATAIPGAGPSINYLSWAKPFIDKSGFTTGSFQQQMAFQTREAALTTPIFMKGCTQFIVEFAGDFFEQTIGEPVGVPDYDTNAAGETRMRWYGLDRDMNGDAAITTTNSGDVTNIAAHAGTSGAVRYNTPVTDVEHLPPASSGEATVWAWEAATAAAGVAPISGAPPTPGPASAGTPGAWQFVRPSYIRITLEIIDPNGRLQDGQRIEFIYPLKTPTAS